MAAENCTKIPYEPNTANRQVESDFRFLFFFFFFFGGGGWGGFGDIRPCNNSILYARFEVFTENFSVRFMSIFRVFIL